MRTSVLTTPPHFNETNEEYGKYPYQSIGKNGPIEKEKEKEKVGGRDEKGKKKRKPKKQMEKELLLQFYEGEGSENCSSFHTPQQQQQNQQQQPYKQRQYYENYPHFSPTEKAQFDGKFTKPKNKSQEEYMRILRQKTNKIVVVTGPAGTGKTLFATEQGIRNYLLGKCEKLVFTRPSVSVDEELGFLPGTLEEKMAPWLRPIYDVLYQFLHPKEVAQLIEEKTIEIAPLGFMRGRTFKNCWIVADEMQNSTLSQMKMLMTRLGENSRIVITGDLEQHDRTDLTMNGLEDFLEKFRFSNSNRRSSSISSFEFQMDDIQREEVVKEVLEIYAGTTTGIAGYYTPPSPSSIASSLSSSFTDIEKENLNK